MDPSSARTRLRSPSQLLRSIIRGNDPVHAHSRKAKKTYHIPPARDQGLYVYTESYGSAARRIMNIWDNNNDTALDSGTDCCREVSNRPNMLLTYITCPPGALLPREPCGRVVSESSGLMRRSLRHVAKVLPAAKGGGGDHSSIPLEEHHEPQPQCRPNHASLRLHPVKTCFPTQCTPSCSTRAHPDLNPARYPSRPTPPVSYPSSPP
jgi:hypothetical protein